MKSAAVLRGGVGEGHDTSLKTGMEALRCLERQGLRPLDLYIDRGGVWHLRGVPVQPARALQGVDVAVNALHGPYGEDGTIQRELERHAVPYTGSAPYASAVGMNKALTKSMLKDTDILMPRHELLGVSPTLEKDILYLFRTFPQPSIIKPVNSGGGLGVTLATSFQQFSEGIKRAFQYSKEVMIEEFVRGREATVGVINNFRNAATYALPPIGVTRPNYDSNTVLQYPTGFTSGEVRALEEAAKNVHDTLGMRHYSRTDFIMTPRGPVFLETNTLPSLGADSSFAHGLTAVGSSIDDFLNHIITMALEKK